MPFNAQVGETFFKDDYNRGHIWVVLTPPNSQGVIVTVNFTGEDPRGENLIWLEYNDMPSLIKKPTTINYGDAETILWNNLVQAVNDPDYLPEMNATRHICPLSAIERIVIMAFYSQHMIIRIQRQLKTTYPSLYAQYSKDN